MVPDLAAGADVVPWEVTDARLAVAPAVSADRRVGELPQPWIEEELQLLEAVERVKAGRLPGSGGAAPVAGGRRGARPGPG